MKESTWVFLMSPELLQHQRNASNMIGNILKSAKISKYDFGAGQSSKNESTVAQALLFHVKMVQMAHTIYHTTVQNMALENSTVRVWNGGGGGGYRGGRRLINNVVFNIISCREVGGN